MRTWHLELATVAAVLATVVVATEAPAIEWVAAAAVVGTFAHAQVADRLAEAEELRILRTGSAAVSCRRWAARYLIAKELFWLTYFIARGAWSALAGVLLLLAYPLWRKHWRRRVRPAGIVDIVITATAVGLAVAGITGLVLLMVYVP